MRGMRTRRALVVLTVASRLADLPTQANTLEFLVRVARASAKLPGCEVQRSNFGDALKVQQESLSRARR